MRRSRILTASLLSAALAFCGSVASSPAQSVEATSRAGRALIAATSIEPVEVALASRVIGLSTEERGTVPPAPADNHIVLRVPAAYLADVSLRHESAFDRGAPGASALTLLFWSRSFDPVRPDEIADLAACRPGEVRPCAAHGPGGGPMVARRRGGEFPLRVQMGSGASSEEHRRYAIRYQAGLARNAGLARAQPCEFHEDTALGMLVGRTPAGERMFSACNVTSSGAIIQSRRFSRATFLKREADGAPRFAVRCPVFTGPEDGVGPSPCEMLGFFGVWPLFLSVPSDRAAEWDGAFERLRTFLAWHAVSRTD